MAEPAERQRTVLRAPRVEFDLSALALGAGGWLAYQWTWPALASVLAVEPAAPTGAGVVASPIPSWHVLRWEFFHRLLGWIGLPFTNFVEDLAGAPGAVLLKATKDGKETPFVYQLADPARAELAVWKLVVVGAWLLVLWSIVAGAVSRVYAVRIARDESIGAGDAVAFSVGNLASFVKAPLFVAAAAAFFFGLAALAGAGTAIPTAGAFLGVVLHPLALLAGLVVTIIAVGGIFGLPVMHAALATERNGALDAISRTFSYVFTRPVAYVVAVGIVAAVAAVIVQFGLAFVGLATRAMQFGGSWNQDAVGALGSGATFALQPGGVMGWPHFSNPESVPLAAAVGVYVAWFVTAAAWTLINGFALAYFVGGLTDTYFLLRRDVDGIDDSEVYVEGETQSLGDPIVGEPVVASPSPTGARP
jgi:hypothetical protein